MPNEAFEQWYQETGYVYPQKRASQEAWKAAARRCAEIANSEMVTAELLAEETASYWEGKANCAFDILTRIRHEFGVEVERG